MKSFSIVAIALCALVALCSAAPVVNQQELTPQLRFDIYQDFLQGLFAGLVQTTLGSVTSALNHLIQTNPLNVGKRNAEDDLQARLDLSILNFVYDNILQDLLSGLVSNTLGHLSSTLTGLIGKRDVESDLQGRIDVNIFTFLYENILQDLLTGIVSNTFGTLTNTLTGLIGKRDAEGARIDLNIFTFLYDNILANLFTGVVTNAANLAQNTLINLITSNPLGVGKRSANFQQLETVIKQTFATLVEHFSTFAHQAVQVWTDKQQLAALINGAITDFKAIIAVFAEQLSAVIPASIAGQVDQLLGSLQSMLVFWTSGLGGSLGPVIGPFPFPH